MVYAVNDHIDSYATIVILIRAAVKKKRMNCVIPSNLIESDFDYFVTTGGFDYSVTKEGDVIISWENPKSDNSVAKYLYNQVMEETKNGYPQKSHPKSGIRNRYR